jgi:hypothetical protein
MSKGIQLSVTTEMVEKLNERLENVKNYEVIRDLSRHVLFSPYLSSLQLLTADKVMIECSSDRRGAVAEIGDKPQIFEIAAGPTTKNIRQSFIGLVKEKVRNDLELCNCLIRSDEFKEIFGEIDKITIEEIGTEGY